MVAYVRDRNRGARWRKFVVVVVVVVRQAHEDIPHLPETIRRAVDVPTSVVIFFDFFRREAILPSDVDDRLIDDM